MAKKGLVFVSIVKREVATMVTPKVKRPNGRKASFNLCALRQESARKINKKTTRYIKKDEVWVELGTCPPGQSVGKKWRVLGFSDQPKVNKKQGGTVEIIHIIPDEIAEDKVESKKDQIRNLGFHTFVDEYRRIDRYLNMKKKLAFATEQLVH